MMKLLKNILRHLRRHKRQEVKPYKQVGCQIKIM